MKWNIVLITGLLLLMSIFHLKATHLRAADITTTRIGDKTYKITVTTYNECASLSNPETGCDLGGVDISEIDIVADKTTYTVQYTNAASVSEDILKVTYEITHTFPSVNTGYYVSFRGDNRTHGIKNMFNSDETPVYIEAYLFIDAFSKINTSPILKNPPIDKGVIDQPWTHNPGAYDVDGDSLSYKLLIPAQDKNKPVDGYSYLDAAIFGQSTFDLNKNTGDMLWNAPRLDGEFNIAVKVEEFRNGFLIGYVIRDMQITIQDLKNQPPVTILPPNQCIESGKIFRDTIVSYDPDGDKVDHDITTYLKSLGVQQLNFRNQGIDSLIFGDFIWTPSCAHVREEPYVATIKAQDFNPIFPLSTTSSFTIKVIGAAPKWKDAFAQNNGNLLNWHKYPCENQIKALKIWRRTCDSGWIERDSCTSGVPESWGYELLTTVTPSDTSFLDTKIKTGNSYYYLLSAEFLQPKGGESYASTVLFLNSSLENGVITSVSVAYQNDNLHINKIDWFYPYKTTDGLNVTILRGNTATSLSPIKTLPWNTDILAYTDSIQTNLSNQYFYQIQFKTTTQTYITDITSSIKAEILVQNDQYKLLWSHTNAWKERDSLYDYIYEIKNNIKTLLDSTPSTKGSYQLKNLQLNETYCYEILQKHTFCHDSIHDIFTANSNRVCVTIIDTTPPCPPLLSSPHNCKNFNQNTPYYLDLQWTYTCTEQLAMVEIYNKPLGITTYQLIEKITADSLHKRRENLTQISNCYAIKVIDKAGNSSPFSNEVCVDNCPKLQLPNIFTPNRDDKNTEWTAIPTPQFIEKYDVTIYNRWGKTLRTLQDLTTLTWDGKDTEGNLVTDGIYYYDVIAYYTTSKGEETINLKGWIMVVR